MMVETGPMLAAAPVAGLAAYCVCHVLAARLLGSRSPYPALAVGSICGLVVAVALSCLGVQGTGAGASDVVAVLAMNVVAYLALAFGYFNFVNLTVASLRIRMLEELFEAGGTLPTSALLGRYDSVAVAALRTERLVRGGHVVERNGRYFRGRLQFLAVARIFDMLRWLILGRTSQ
jgi:hypothetical protein